MNATKIEWCDFTWNPVTGCPGPKVSPGCDHCYAERAANTRLFPYYKKFSSDIALPVGGPFQRMYFHRDRLDQPRKIKKPSRIFVGSMCDLFHDWCAGAWIQELFFIMAECPQHTFMLLTKRPERMRSVIGFFSRGVLAEVEGWPLSNIWLGVTVCNQAEADAKIPVLMEIPAAKRFVSVEPMLGPVDLNNIFPEFSRRPSKTCGTPWGHKISALNGQVNRGTHYGGRAEFGKLDWVICGGETGPKARPLNYAWAYNLAEQCWSAGTPFFFKSWGEWTPAFYQPDGGYKVNPDADIPHGYEAAYHVFPENPGIRMYKVGKKRSGRSFDERGEWNEVPA